MIQKMLLYRWPESQQAMALPGAALVDNADLNGNPNGLDCAYMVPVKAVDKALKKNPDNLSLKENAGVFILIEFPDSQAHLEEEDTLWDYEGNCYVPVEV